MGAYVAPLEPGLELHLRHGGYRRERLAPEPHGVQGEQVVGLAYLRRGVALERQARVGLRHARAVVDYLYRRAPGVDHKHVDGGGAGIDGVLNQFFYHRSRALYHLAGGYLVCHGVGQQLYDVTH